MNLIQLATRTYKELIRYWHYLIKYVNALQTVRVSNTFLGYIWWFLDPLLNMVIYIVLVRMVFSQREDNFPVFFFSAMIVWRYFSMTVTQAATSIIAYLDIFKDTYIPKFVFPLALALSGIYPFLVSLGILFVLMMLFNITFTVYLFYLPLLSIVLLLFTVACSIIVAHITVFMNDFNNIIPHLLTLGMFATPIFYDISLVPSQYLIFFKLNPLAVLTSAFRNILTYGRAPNITAVLGVLLLSIILLLFGLSLLYKYDRVYNRVSK